jgi:hypothetical protein
VAQARILRRPFSSESVPLLELAWGDGGGDRVALEPGGESTTIELGRAPDSALTVPGAGVRTIEMAVTAAASGVLTLERTTTLYREAGQ